MTPTLLAATAPLRALGAVTTTHTSWASIVITLIVIPVLVAGLTAIVTLAVTKAGEATARRRKRYADAVKTLVAWVEYPYRVRRRTDDSPATLAALAGQAHDLQEQLAFHHAWITADHPRLADSYAKARAAVTAAVGPAVTAAWDSPPVTTAAGMNLGQWGPAAACADAIAELQCHISLCFGLRRWRRHPQDCPPARSRPAPTPPAIALNGQSDARPAGTPVATASAAPEAPPARRTA